MANHVKDLTGQRFGMLIAQRRFVVGEASWWECICDCGEKVNRRMESLTRPQNSNCGRHQVELVNGHGMSRTNIYKSWVSMVQRCTNPNTQSWANYGQRGIRVCERWLDFKNFYEDMGDPPFPLASIERENNNGNYEPGNVKWASKAEQNRNQRSNILVTMNGKTQVLKDWCDELGMPYTTVKARIKRLGMMPEEALTTPVRPMQRRENKAYRQAVYVTLDTGDGQGPRNLRLAEWCRELVLPYGTVVARISKGWDPIKALTTPLRGS